MLAVADRYTLPTDDTAAQTWAAEVGGVRVLFGEGILCGLGDEVRDLGASRALLVSDAGVEAAGWVARALECLDASGIATVAFTGVTENPTTDEVAAGAEVAREHGADILIGLGGGSPMDVAKGINFLLTQGGQIADYWGWAKAKAPMLPSIGVPTTAGTGSDSQSFALISDATTHAKMACGAPAARFRSVLLDPALLTSVPKWVRATAGLDAIAHAVESYVSRKRNPIAQLYAREAWRLLDGSFETYLATPTDLDARGAMLFGAHLSGAAIEASMLGAAHALANPLTKHFDVIHGSAVALMLPSVVRFNAQAVAPLYAELATDAETLAARLEDLRHVAGMPATLAEAGVDGDALDTLVSDAAGQWTARFNPRPLETSDLLDLYRQVSTPVSLAGSV
ncbi:MAG: iron-containing alcohol dehydrogenase [Acidobacteriota bacterium]